MSQLNPVTARRTLEMLRSAMGPVIGAALDDKNVIEIMVNPDGKLWLDRHGERSLNIQPTLSVRLGWRFSVIVSKDIILKPYQN